jgi:hypothetical protein
MEFEKYNVEMDKWKDLANRNRKAYTYIFNKCIKASDAFLACPLWRIFKFNRLLKISNYWQKIYNASYKDYSKFLDDWTKANHNT